MKPAPQAPVRVAVDARMLHYRREGGIGQYVLGILNGYARLKMGADGSRIYVLQMRADREPAVRGKGFRRVPMWTPPHNRFEQPALGVELLKMRPAPQLIHSPDFVPPRFRLFRAVANIQDLAFLKFPELTLLTEESKRYYGQVPRAAEDADALIALSRSARDDMVEILGIAPDKIAIIPAAAGAHFRPPPDLHVAQQEAAEEFGLPKPDEGGYALFVSTIEPRKNLPVLLEAYSLVRDRKRVTPLPMLVVAGSEGWLYKEVYKRVDELHLRGNVCFLGPVPAPGLVRLYRGARLFAMPSIYEGFGMPALEAMACGTPTIVSTGGSLPEVVADAGITLDPHDVDGWAGALERVLTDEEEGLRLREVGPRRAAHFSWERAARETWGLYRRVVRGESPRKGEV